MKKHQIPDTNRAFFQEFAALVYKFVRIEYFSLILCLEIIKSNIIMNRVSKMLLSLATMLVAFSASAFDLSSLGSLLNSDTANDILNLLVSKSDLEVKDLAGTWKYKAPAVAFESEDLLNKAGGEYMAGVIEDKMAPYYKRVGLDNMVLTIDAEGNFELKFKKGTASGTIEKTDDGRFQFNFNSLGRYKIAEAKAYVKKGTTLQVTFDVTKLIDIVTKIASYSKTSTLSTVTTLLKGYKGMYSGFELEAK